MDKYEFKATNLIVEAFEKRSMKFDVVSRMGREQVVAGFSIDCGPEVMVRFISRDNDNDVAVRIFGLISSIPQDKRARIMDACNVLNRKIRYIKFYIDRDGDINVEYDFPVHTPDEGVGEMAFEIFCRMMRILDSEYGIFMKALYTDDELDIREESHSAERMQQLQELREMLEARLSELSTVTGKDSTDDAQNLETDDSAESIPC